MDQADRRKAQRVMHVVEIRYASDSPPMTARLTDVSGKGMFVDVSNPLPAGSRVTFSFLLTANPWDKPITGEGKVVWRQEGVGMGIEFLNLNEEDRSKINLFVANQS